MKNESNIENINMNEIRFAIKNDNYVKMPINLENIDLAYENKIWLFVSVQELLNKITIHITLLQYKNYYTLYNFVDKSKIFRKLS